MFKKLLMVVPALAIISIPALASAHVVVTPSTASVGESVTFSVSVPNEKDTPVTNLKLLLPDGLDEVTPTVKAGWTIDTTTNGDAKDPATTSIIWSGGSIPAGLRDDFTFEAQVPAKATDLDWKAYQTYGDGSVVHWDQKPAGSDDADGDAGPYSVTKISDDLAATTTANKQSTPSNTLPIVLSVVALVVSIASALSAVIRKK